MSPAEQAVGVREGETGTFGACALESFKRPEGLGGADHPPKIRGAHCPVPSTVGRGPLLAV